MSLLSTTEKGLEDLPMTLKVRLSCALSLVISLLLASSLQSQAQTLTSSVTVGGFTASSGPISPASANSETSVGETYDPISGLPSSPNYTDPESIVFGDNTAITGPGVVRSIGPDSDSAVAITAEGINHVFASSLAAGSSGLFSIPTYSENTATSTYSDTFTILPIFGDIIGTPLPTNINMAEVAFTISVDDTATETGGYDSINVGDAGLNVSFSTTNTFGSYTDAASTPGNLSFGFSPQSDVSGAVTGDSGGISDYFENNSPEDANATFTTDAFQLSNSGSINGTFSLEAFAEYGVADFSNTATLTGITVYDQNGNIVNPADYSVSSASGASYPFAGSPAPAPETSTLVLMGIGLLVMIGVVTSSKRKRRGFATT